MEKHLNRYRINTPPPPKKKKKNCKRSYLKGTKVKKAFYNPTTFAKIATKTLHCYERKKVTKIARITNLAKKNKGKERPLMVRQFREVTRISLQQPKLFQFAKVQACTEKDKEGHEECNKLR